MQPTGADAPEQRPEGAYPIVLARAANGDGPAWIATVEELPGCQAHGPTPESAAAGMTEAVERWVRDARAAGREVPPPGAAAAHSGKLLVRMPRSLHAELVRASDREGTSLNAYIVAALSASVAWRRPGSADQPDGGPAASGLSLALKVNLVVLAIAAAVAIALLITAWA
jgi:antitoxin HicB